jgi:hypothetical protein
MVEVEVDVVPGSLRIVEGESAAAAAIVNVDQPEIATVDANGVVAGQTRGTTRIRATSGGVSGVAFVTVVRPQRGDGNGNGNGGNGGGDDDDDDDDDDCPVSLEILGLCDD